MNKYPPQNIAPTIISQPKASLILKSYGLGALKTRIYGDIEQEATDIQDGASRFGTPVFDNIVFLAPDYFERVPKEEAGMTTLKSQIVVLGGNVNVGDDGTQVSKAEIKDLEGVGFNAFKVNTVLIDVTQQRNVITTAIAGARGTIKEYINDGDYQIKIRGFIESDSPYKYPGVDVGTFSSYLKAPVPITVISNYLRSFSIDRIVVTGYSFPQTEGRRNLQFFEIDAISELEAENEFIKFS